MTRAQLERMRRFNARAEVLWLAPWPRQRVSLAWWCGAVVVLVLLGLAVRS